MKSKRQKVKYIEGRFCDTINDYYLDNGWYIVMIVPAATKDSFGAYVVLEKETNEIESTLNDVGVTIYNPDGTQKTVNKVLDDIAKRWSEME